MMKIQSVRALQDSKIYLVFMDGTKSTLDLTALLSKGPARELREPLRFQTVHTDGGGGIKWENGCDICPNVLRELATASNTENL